MDVAEEVREDEATETPPDPETETEGDEDGETETPPESEAEPAPEAMSEKDIERMTGQLEREASRHANQVSRIMGEDAQVLVPCEVCEPAIPGFRWPQVDEDDPRAPLYAILTGGMDASPPDDDEAVKCDRCDGFGVTVTHSRVPEQAVRPCTKCSAKGWTSETERAAWDSAHASRLVAAEIRAETPNGYTPIPALPTVDPWGRQQGAPFFGLNPDYMTPEQTAQDWQRAK